MVADVRTRLWMLLGAVVLILLIACANVANLTLSRAATREKEISIRAALGAGRRRIVRQLLTESIVLALVGGLFGLALGAAGLSLLKSALPADTPRLMEVRMDWRVLAFTGGLSLLTGLIFGFAPALQSARASLVESLNSAGRGTASPLSRRLRASLAVTEVGFACLLTIAAGLLIRSFWALSHVNPGFQAEPVVTARITPSESFCSDAGRCLAFYRSLLDQTKAAPGISGAALVNTLPLGGRVAKRSLDLEGYQVPQAGTAPLFWLNVVTPDYFRVMGIPMREGAGFSESESGNTSFAVVTAATARRFWPGQNAVGKHFRFVGESEWRTVVGVIADVRAYDLQRSVPDWMAGTVYVPLSAKSTLEGGRIPTEMTLALRTNVGQSQVEAVLRRIVAGLNQQVPVGEVKAMTAVVSEAVSTPASTTFLFVASAGLALVLGMVGIYGVLAFLVSRRTREIGIRIALGAQRRDVLWLVLREGARFAVFGIALGLASAGVVTRWLASELYGLSWLDPATYAGVAVVMASVALLACYVPARRAARVDPMVALRYE
jgi:putative ABC transport system permease protein